MAPYLQLWRRMNLLRLLRLPVFYKRAMAILLFSLMALVGIGWVCPASSEASPHDQIKLPAKTGGSTSEVYSPTPPGKSVSTVYNLIAQIRMVHPLILAVAQVFAVVGICLLLTDNRELELYFKIEYQPPKTDILN